MHTENDISGLYAQSSDESEYIFKTYLDDAFQEDLPKEAQCYRRLSFRLRRRSTLYQQTLPSIVRRLKY